MAGFLNLDLLRAHRTPRTPWDDRDAGRPNLVAHWRLDSEGRLTCRWSEREAPSEPPN